jgi:hypothetical protein
MSEQSHHKPCGQNETPEGLWKPGPLISTPESANKALLPSGFVRVLPASKGGHAYLEFRNETDARRIKVQNAICLIPRGGYAAASLWQGIQLLDNPILLGKGEEGIMQTDITGSLKNAINNAYGSLDGIFLFRIRLDLEPEPWQQSAPGAFKASLKGGQFDEFSADR